MYRGLKITVVVPAFNEERHILSVIKTLPAFVDQIIVIDDSSRDSTFALVTQFNDKRTIAMQTVRNQGVGGAMIVGYRKALELGCDIVVKMDGDGQMLPDFLEPLLEPLVDGGFDYAKGNRFLAPEALTAMPKVRLLGNIILTFMTKLASGYWHIFDYQNGYTAIRAEVLKRVDFTTLNKRFFFENDMLVQLSLQRARVKDVAMLSRYADEVSSLNLLQIIFTFPLLLLRRFFSRIWHNHVIVDFSAVALFLYLGLALSGWGVLFGAYTWIRSSVTGELASTGTVMLSVLPLILGFQLLLQAIVLDIAETPK